MVTPSIICYADPRKSYSVELCAAFAQGCGGLVATDFKYREGIAVIHGMAEPQRNVMRAASAAGADWYELDHGYLGRGQYHRCQKHALWCSASAPRSVARLDGLGISFENPRIIKRGDIILCAQSAAAYDYWGLNYDRWLSDTLRALRSNSPRRVQIRPKPIGLHRHQMPLGTVLRTAWACAVHSSSSALEALAAGLPVVVTDKSFPAASLATPPEQIEQPYRPSVEARRHLFSTLAANQWTLEEFRSGLAWRQLNGDR